MEEIKNYHHTRQESAEAFAELQAVQKKSMELFNRYLAEEKPLRGKEDYMELRKPHLIAYRNEDTILWDDFVNKYSELGWHIGSK